MGELLIGIIAFAVVYGIFKVINDAAGDSLGKPCCGHNGLRKVGISGFYENGKLQSEWKCMQCGKKIYNIFLKSYIL